MLPLDNFRLPDDRADRVKFPKVADCRRGRDRLRERAVDATDADLALTRFVERLRERPRTASLAGPLGLAILIRARRGIKLTKWVLG